jgi:hypothetical protein
MNADEHGYKNQIDYYLGMEAELDRLGQKYYPPIIAEKR